MADYFFTSDAKDAELTFKTFDDYISIMLHPKEEEAQAYHFALNYHEFMKLAEWMGFEITPKDYRKVLSF